ncbi:MAG: 30S ribosomal protein S8 [Deltaproteobacteria bacterium]|nr:30S ribosomal protein S8 [Deltaproteobacteria bacterium]
MGMTDPIADLLTRIRNAIRARHESVVCPSSKMKEHLCGVLKQNGFIRDFHVEEKDSCSMIMIELKYDETRRPAITGLRRVSTPGRRVYVKNKEIPRVLNGLGISILSTSKGILGDREARAANIGGEVICSVW